MVQKKNERCEAAPLAMRTLKYPGFPMGPSTPDSAWDNYDNEDERCLFCPVIVGNSNAFVSSILKNV